MHIPHPNASLPYTASASGANVKTSHEGVDDLFVIPIGNAIICFWKKELTGVCVIDKSSIGSFCHHISATQFE